MSGSQNGPRPGAWPDPPPAWLVRAVLWLRHTLRRLLTNLVPPLALFEDSIGLASTRLLEVVVRLGIVEELEKGPATAVDLAARLGLRSQPLHRALRGLASRGYFDLDAQGRFGNTRLSRLLLADHPEHARDFLCYFASQSNAAAWGQLDETLRTGLNGFQLAHGRSVWAYFADHPDQEANFARQMQGLTYRDAPTLALHYPFAQRASLCDLAGGQGGLVSEIALRYPALRCALVDLPGVAQLARSEVARRGANVEVIEGDIFQTVPSGFELYLLKNVLHDWADEDCLRILAQVKKAMGPESRVLVVELRQEPNQPDPIASLVDLQMMVVTDNGQERSRAEFEALFARLGFRRTNQADLPTFSWYEFSL